MKRVLSISIVLFWCLMNLLLLRRQLWAPTLPIPLDTVSAIQEPMEEWWGIYYREGKIGYATQKVTPGAGGYRVQASSVMRLNLLGTTQTVKTSLDTKTASDWTLEQFAFTLSSDGVRFHARGEILQGNLQLELDSGGHRTKKTLSMKQPPYLLATLKPYVVSQNLEPGREQLFPVFDPSTLSLQVATLTVEGRERISIGGKMEPAIRIRQRFKGISVVSWVDGQGKTLKEESPGGFALVREKAGEASASGQAPSVPLDLILQISVPLQGKIAEPEQRRSLKLKLSGFDLSHFALEGGRQRRNGDVIEIEREAPAQAPSYPIPSRDMRFAAYLQATPFLQSDHPRIRNLAQQILGGETDASKAVHRLMQWVYNGIAKEPTVSIPNALEVLQTRKGDCNEHTVLFNALARAAGIPAKTVVGVVHLRGAFYYHAWSEVWLGQWMSVDSVLNQFPADVTHIKFLEGEIDRQIEILELIGKLKIQVMEES